MSLKKALIDFVCHVSFKGSEILDMEVAQASWMAWLIQELFPTAQKGLVTCEMHYC